MPVIRKKQVECLLKHVLYKNISTIAKIRESRAALKEKNLPLWVEEPVKQIMDEITDDLTIAIAPLFSMAKSEYSSRQDRLDLIKSLEFRFKELELKDGMESECHCAACLESKD